MVNLSDSHLLSIPCRNRVKIIFFTYIETVNMVYICICDGHQILDHKPNRYGMSTCIKCLYSHSLQVWCKALYRSVGKYADAEMFEIKVLDVRNRLLGGEHLHTILAMGNLAKAYRSLGKDVDAEMLERKVLDMRIRLLGEEPVLYSTPPIPVGIRSFQQNSGGIHRNSQEFTGILLEFCWNSTGIKQTKVEILYLTLHFVLIYRTTYFSLLSLLFLHLFKSVSHLQSLYSSTLPLGYYFK